MNDVENRRTVAGGAPHALPRRDGWRRHAVTLTEVLVALTLGGALLASAVQLTCTAWSGTRRAIRRAHDLQEIRLLARRWRHIVGQTDARGWVVADRIFSNGRFEVRFNGRELCELQPGAEPVRNRLLPLPSGAAVRFTRESSAGQAEMAVLWLAWPTARRKTEQCVRIVACPQEVRRGGEPGSS